MKIKTKTIIGGIVGLVILSVYVFQSNKTSIKSEEDSYFLFISDIHLHAGMDTVTGENDDTMQPLWNAALENLKRVVNGDNPPAFILYTGDLPAHGGSPDVDSSSHEKNISTVLKDLASLAKKEVPLFYAPGNNDPLGGDYCQFKLFDNTPLSEFGKAYGYPAPHADTIFNVHTEYGYYAASPAKGLRIIGLNTVMFSPSYVFDDYWHCVSKRANKEEQIKRVNQQLAWLRTNLEQAKTANEKAYLIMHIPPGIDAYSGHMMWATTNKDSVTEDVGWNDSLLVICDSYKEQISGLFYGHTHMDEIRRLAHPTKPNSFTKLAMSAPGISPKFGNNPGYKKVFFNANYQPTNFITHYTNFDKQIKGWNNWEDSTYRFSNYFDHGANTMEKTLLNPALSMKDIGNQMIKFYTVQAAPSTSGYIVEAIDVLPSNK
jgi:sphingomyelin phosphodiesterase acid-like 3